MPAGQKFLVIAYDITSDRRRSRLVKVLSGYGVRVNYSVFECRLKRAAIKELKKKIAKVISKKDDSVLFYELCRDCEIKADALGWREASPAAPAPSVVTI